MIAMLGPVGPAQLACFRSWRKCGVATQFLDTEVRPLPKWAQGIVDRYEHIGPVPGLDAAAMDCVSLAMQRSGARAICCVSEQMAMRLWHQSDRLPAGSMVLGNPEQTLARLESKLEQVELGRLAGFDVLPSFAVSSLNIESVIDRLVFPLALRPDRASLDGSFKAEYVENQAELRGFLATRGPQAPGVVAQRFITGPSLVIHGSRDLQGRPGVLHGYIGRLKQGGVTVTLEPFELPQQIQSACDKFAQLLDLHGVFHFDLMLEPQTGQMWFLEVNARFGGTTAKAYASGYDEPRAMLEAFELISLDSSANTSTKMGKAAVNRMAALKAFLSGLRGQGSRVDFPYPSRLQVIFRSLRAAIFYADEVLTLSSPTSMLAFLSQYLPKGRRP